jgi:hypothetical protein
MSTHSTTGIPDLWPKEIEQIVLTPLAIMRAQATILRERTKNLLEAEIASRDVPTNRVKHTFVLIAPALERYSYSLFSVEHDKNLVYPAAVASPALNDLREYSDGAVAASSQGEFTKLMGIILQDDKTRAVVSSLLAKSNEASLG